MMTEGQHVLWPRFSYVAIWSNADVDASKTGHFNRTLGTRTQRPDQPGMQRCLDSAHAGPRGKPRPITAMHAHATRPRDLLVHSV